MIRLHTIILFYLLVNLTIAVNLVLHHIVNSLYVNLMMHDYS